MRNSIDNPRTFRREHPNRFRVKKYDERLTDDDIRRLDNFAIWKDGILTRYREGMNSLHEENSYKKLNEVRNFLRKHLKEDAPAFLWKEHVQKWKKESKRIDELTSFRNVISSLFSVSSFSEIIEVLETVTKSYKLDKKFKSELKLLMECYRKTDDVYSDLKRYEKDMESIDRDYYDEFNNYNLNNSIDSQKKLIDEYICKSPRYMCDTWKEFKKINNTVNYVPSETVLKHLNPVDMFELPDRRAKFCVYQEINGYWPIAIFKSSFGYNTTRELVCMKNCKSRKEAYNLILDAMAVFQNGCYSGMVPTYRY